MTEETSFTPAEKNFATEVARERQQRGWTLAEMAEKLEAAGVPSMSVMSVSRVENRKRHVSMVEAGAYAKVLGRGISDLQHPDGREAMLMIFEVGRRHTVSEYNKLLEAAKDFGDSVAVLSTHVTTVRDLYGADFDDLDEETRSRVNNFMQGSLWLIEKDPVAEVQGIIEKSWKQHGER